jgi:gamma-glutamyltranspeptidase/glutathione hydrolase
MVHKFFVQLFFILCFCQSIISQSAIYDGDHIHHPVIGESGMVASQHPEATKAGIEILKKGGNAIDAAVAVGFSLAVVLPRAGNIGGGGFMLVYKPGMEAPTAINYREMAPAAAFKEMYLDDNGLVDNTRFNLSHLSVGVPGTVAGLINALEKYGTMELKDVMAPAIRQAEKGFAVTYDLAHLLKEYENILGKWPSTRKIFYKKNGGYYKAGDILIQKDLAWSLKAIAKDGMKAFYGGKVGKKLSAYLLENGGIITIDDLINYYSTEIPAVQGNYRGYDIFSMPPPSSGGVHLIQILNILEKYDLKSMGHNSAEAIHVMVESMKHGYADRSAHLGDPAFWAVPVDWLTSKKYAQQVQKEIMRSVATPSELIKPGTPTDNESEETTHFTVADKYGNVVSNTYTLNFSYGTGIVAEGTGILLNNEMGDFSAKPGTPDAYGLIGGEANAVEAGKRPLSSMTPTMVFKNDKPYLITGSPGGSRIITTVLQIISNVIDHEMNIADASHAPRFHHQWYPDLLFVERGISIDTKRILIKKGHNPQLLSVMGSTQSIFLDENYLYGASDPRRPDGHTIGY